MNSQIQNSIMKRSNFGQIEDAISKMQDLLGQDSLSAQINTQQLEAQNIEGYLALLNEKYCNIMEILNQEDSLLNQVQKDNLKLKAALAEEIKNHENTINDSKKEINELREKNKQILDQKSTQRMEKQYREIQLNKIRDQIENYESDINNLMKQSVINKSALAELQAQNQKLISEYEELQQLHQNTQVDFNYTLEQLNQLEDKIGSNKRIFNQTQSKNKQLEAKILVVNDEQVNLEGNTSQIMKDQQQSALKNSQKLKKLQELQKLKDKLQNEIELKSQQLTTLRTQNLEIQQKVDQLANTSNQLQQEQQINLELKIENEFLNWQISEINQKNFQSGNMGQSAAKYDMFNVEQKFQPGAFSSMVLKSQVNTEKQDEYLNRILLNKDVGNRETYQMTEDIEKIKEEQQRQYEEIQQLEKVIYEKDEVLQSQQDTLQQLFNQQGSLSTQIREKQTQKENAQYKYNSMKREMELMEQRYNQLLNQIKHIGVGGQSSASQLLQSQQKSKQQQQYFQQQQLLQQQQEDAEEEARQASIKAEISPQKFLQNEENQQQKQQMQQEEFDYNLVQIQQQQSQQKQQQYQQNVERFDDDDDENDDILIKSPIKLDDELRQIKSSNKKL